MNKRAYTLVEVLLTLVILGIIMGIGTSAMLSGIETWGVFTQRKELLGNGTMAIDRMLREIRMVRDTAGITTADQSNIVFTDTNNNSIRFYLSGTTLNRSRRMFGAWWPNGLLRNVRRLEFNYYNAAGAVLGRPVSDGSSIRRIRIDIELSKGSGRIASGTVSLESDVWPRNLR